MACDLSGRLKGGELALRTVQVLVLGVRTHVNGPHPAAVGNECPLDHSPAGETFNARKVASVVAEHACDSGQQIEKTDKPRGPHELLHLVFTEAALLASSC